MAASCKETKYVSLQIQYFQPIAGETLGPINESATSFLYELGRRISLLCGEDREPQFLFQRFSLAIQRFNAVLLHDVFFLSSGHLQTLIFSLFFPSSGIYIYRGLKTKTKIITGEGCSQSVPGAYDGLCIWHRVILRKGRIDTA